MYGLARSTSLLEEFELSLVALKKAIEFGYWWSADNGAKMLERPELEPLRKAKPDEINELRKTLDDQLAKRLAKKEEL